MVGEGEFHEACRHLALRGVDVHVALARPCVDVFGVRMRWCIRALHLLAEQHLLLELRPEAVPCLALFAVHLRHTGFLGLYGERHEGEE